MNILSYDYHSAFEPAVNHHSPLYPLEEENEYNFDAQLSIVSYKIWNNKILVHYLWTQSNPWLKTWIRQGFYLMETLTQRKVVRFFQGGPMRMESMKGGYSGKKNGFQRKKVLWIAGEMHWVDHKQQLGTKLWLVVH